MATTEIIGLDELLEYTNDLPGHLFEEAKGEYQKSSLALQKTMTDRVSGIVLKRRTGQLARSFNSKVTGETLKTLGASVYTTSPYAPMHESGGTIEAKRAYMMLPGGPYLNIPSSANKTPAGVMRRSATEVFAAGAYIAKISAPKAKYAVFEKGSGLPMFWLVKSVDIPARLGMKKEAGDEASTLLSNLHDAMQRGLEN